MNRSAVASPPWPTSRQAHFSLFVLTVVVMFTVLDRQILALMIEPLKADFGISDTQAALLLGAAFSLTYAIAGLPIARLADRMNRRNLVAICLAAWSGATMACGLAQSYAALLLARMGVGIGESGYGPASWSIVSDSFKREKVAFATGMLGIGAMAGTGMAMFLGGAVLALVKGSPPIELPIVGVMRPWQWAFIIVGAPGLLWALLVLTTHEPARQGAAGPKRRSVPIREVARFMGQDWRTYLATIGGTCIKNLLALGPGLWMPTMLHREFGWALSDAGLWLGAITIVCSPVGMVAGGKLSEAWVRKGQTDANLRIVLYALYASVPLSIVTPLLPGAWLVLAAYALQMLVTGLGFGPGIASFQLVTPNAMRAQVSSVTQFSANVLAFALSPLIVALFTDFLFRDSAQLKYSIALSALVFGPVAIVIVAQGMGPYRRSYERAERENF
ncbi:MAG: MFS transporter [Gammaproteobacteria bacterium]